MNVAPTATPNPQVVLGETVFRRECAACHSVAPDVVIVGPSLADIGRRAGTRVPDQNATDYLLLSILEPEAFLVADFENAMPSNLGKKLTGPEIDAVVAYLLTLETD